MLVNVIFLVITLTHLTVGQQPQDERRSTSASVGQSPAVARSLPPTTGGNVNRCSGQWRFPANCRSSSCQYLCQWKFNHDRDQVDFTLSTNRPDKWVGVGFSRDSKMPATDVIVAWVEPGSRYVMMDAWLDSYSIPIPDTKQSVQNISAAAANGLISFSFSRPLKTGDDIHDLDFDECLHFVFPVGGGSVDTKQRLVAKHDRTPMISPNKLCFNSCRAKHSSSTSSPSISSTASTSSSSSTSSSPFTPSTRAPYTRTRIRTPSTTTTTTTTTTTAPVYSTEVPTTKYSRFDTSDTANSGSSSLSDKKKFAEGQPAIVNSDKEEDELIRKKEGGLNQATATTTSNGASAAGAGESDSLSKEKTINQPSVAVEGEESEGITDCKGEWKYPSKCTGYGCDYKAIWEYIDDLDEIMFTVSTKNRNKWTGIGFSNDKSMPGTDAVLGLVEESGRFFLMDTYLRSYSAPPLDQVQNIHNMSVWRENGITTLQFNRKRRTGDRSDFQFSDLNCPYFVFPVQGGVFNAINKRLRKHEETPIVSSHKICVKSCKPKLSGTTSTFTTSTTSSTRSTSSVQSSSSSSPPSSSSFSTTSRPTISTVSTSTSVRMQSSPGTIKKNNGNHNIFDVSQFGPNFPDLSKLSQGSKIDFANVTAILSGMNLTSSDIPNLLKTFASKFPRNESVDPSTYFSIPPFVTSSTSSPPASSSTTHSDPKSSPDYGGHDDTNTKYSDTPAIVVSSAPASTTKPSYKRISPRTRAPSRWSTTSTTTTTTTTTPPSSTTSETTEDGGDDEDEENEDSTGSTSTTVATVQNELEPESNYVVELKLPKAWKSVYARKKSDEYKTFSNHVEDEITKELREKFSNLEVKVMELKSALDSSSGSSLPLLEQQQHSLIAKLKLKITSKQKQNSSSGVNEVVRAVGAKGDGSSVSNRSPETVKEALNLAIKDGRVGDFSVDSSYLIIRPLANEGQGPSDGESKEGDALLTPQQLQWTLISVGVAALLFLLCIQCYCSCVAGKKDRTRNIQKDGKVMVNGHWRDHYNSNGHLAGNGTPYTYENFGLSDESDHLNGKLIQHHLMNGKSKPTSSSSNNRDRISNGHHSSSYPQNHHNNHYNNSSSHHNNNSDHHQGGHHHNNHREREDQPTRERRRERGTDQQHHQQHLSRHPQSSSNNSGIGLQPDFYFMPHQRRYSGEVVRVFVDYNKEQPK